MPEQKPSFCNSESALWHYQQQEPDQEIQNAIDEVALRNFPEFNGGLVPVIICQYCHTSWITGNNLWSSGCFCTHCSRPLSKNFGFGQRNRYSNEHHCLRVNSGNPCMISFSILGAKANTIIEEIDEFGKAVELSVLKEGYKEMPYAKERTDRAERIKGHFHNKAGQ